MFPPVARESDVTLLEGAKRMDRESLVKIFDLYSSVLYNYVYRLCNDALKADFIVGDVFAKLLEHLSVGRGPSTNLRSYLYEIAYHLIVDDARHNNRSAPIEVLDLLPADGHATNISVEDRVLFESILRAIMNNLTDDQRHVIVLRFLEGFSVQETAAIIGKEESNVKVIQNRAITALRKVLDYEGV